MIYLIYISSAVTPFTQSEFEALLGPCREKNGQLDITGMLLHKDGQFMQVLEGEDAAVRQLFEAICRDPRHGGVTVVAQGSLVEREFGESPMGFCDYGAALERGLPGLERFRHKRLDDAEFKANPDNCMALLRLCGGKIFQAPGIAFPHEELRGGELVQVNILGGGKLNYFFGRYIGCVPDWSLLATLSDSKGKIPVLRRNQILNVRMTLQGDVYLFQSAVLCARTHPYRYFHLTYPGFVEHINFREWPRVGVALKATVRGVRDFSDGSRQAPAQVVNIGLGGALLECGVRLGNVDDQIRLTMDLRLATIRRELTLICVIRSENIREEKPSRRPAARYGVQFLWENGEDKNFLYAYVCEQIIHARTHFGM